MTDETMTDAEYLAACYADRAAATPEGAEHDLRTAAEYAAEDADDEAELCDCNHCGRTLPYDDTDSGTCPECNAAIMAADEAEGDVLNAEEALAELLEQMAEKRADLAAARAAFKAAAKARDRRAV